MHVQSFVMEDIYQKCDVLIGFNTHITEENYTLISKNKIEVEYEKGETPIKQGTHADDIMILKDGLLKKVVQSNNKKNIIVKLITPGEYVGLPGLANDEEYPYSVIALKRSTVCILRKKSVLELFNLNPQFQTYILKFISNDFKNTLKKLCLISTKQVHGRLAETLVYLSQERFEKEEVFKYLTRKDIAELAGMSVESMTKVFNEFKSDKLIEVKEKNVFIKDLRLLHKLIEYS